MGGSWRLPRDPAARHRVDARRRGGSRGQRSSARRRHHELVHGRRTRDRGPQLAGDSIRSVSADYAWSPASRRGRTSSAARRYRRRARGARHQRDRAALFFPTQDPLGQQIAFWGTPRTIVGVVADEKMHGLSQAAPPVAYAPVGQLPLADTLLVRTKGDPAAFASRCAGVFATPIPGSRSSVWSRSTRPAASLAQERFTIMLFGLFAA